LSFPDVATSSTVANSAIQDSGIKGLTSQQLLTNTSITTTRSNIYKVTVGYATAAGPTKLSNALAADAAKLYENLAAAQPAPSLIAALDNLRIEYHNQYVAATQAL